MERRSMTDVFRDRRVLLRMTQQEVADAAGISRTMYYMIESETKGTTVETAAKIASSLGMTKGEFRTLWMEETEREIDAAWMDAHKPHNEQGQTQGR